MTERKVTKKEEHLIERKIMVTASLSFWVGGLVLSYWFNIGLGNLFGFDALINAILLTISVFIFSVLFFGKLTPLVFLAVGFMQSSSIIANPWNLLLIVPIMFAAYGGSYLGVYLLRDLEGKDNVFLHNKRILTHLGVAIVLAIIMPFVISYLFGLNLF